MDTIKKIFRGNFIEKTLALMPKSPESFLGRIVPGNYLYSKGSVRSVKRNDIAMKLDISEYGQHYVYFNYTDLSLKALLELAKPGMVVYDIGCNIGWTSLNLAKKVTAEGIVYAFEPDPVNFKIAQYNVALNSQYNNIVIENIGLGAKKGEFKLFQVDDKNIGMRQIREDADSAFSLVQVEILDEYLKRVPGLIKIDTEGYEMNILKGAINVLKKYSPALFIEVDDNNLRIQKSSAGELIEFLASLNYTVFEAEHNTKVLPTDNFTNCHFDVVCQPLK